VRNGIILAGIAFAIALAVIVGNRLSNEAMAVVVGTVCGISASIPVSIGLVIASSHNWGRRETPREIGYDYGAHQYAPQPPVVIVSPPQPQMPYGYPAQPYALPAPMNTNTIESRDFKIVGGEP